MTAPHKSNRRILWLMLGVILFMVALTAASVPLYRIFCQQTGLGGTTQRETPAEAKVHQLTKPSERTVTIRLDSQVHEGLPWQFKAETHTVDVHLGQQEKVNYLAQNQAKQATTGMAVYNVSPPKAGKYFFKLQCFCFTKQTLKPGESVKMPVTFFVDPDMDKDPTMTDVSTITLSYTFYPAASPALKAAQAKFERDQEKESQ